MIDLPFIAFDADEGWEHELRLKREFYYVLDPLLRAAQLENALYWYDRTSYQTVVTSVERTKKENKKIRGYEFSGHLARTVGEDGKIVYALDIRTRNMNETLRQSYQGRFTLTWNGRLYIQFHKNHLHSGVPRIHQVGKIA